MKLKINKSLLSFYAVWVALGVAFVFAIFRADWLIAFVALSTFILTVVPYVLRNKYRFYVPLEFTAAIAVFIYAAIFLGEAQNFYEKFWWWDSMLHMGSAIGFGLIGIVILLLLYKGDKVKAHPRILSLFAFFFAIALGALWEMFEFIMDQLFGFHMQKNGLHDTMWDLIVGAIGAGISSISGYLYITKGSKRLLNKFIHEWVTKKHSK